MFLSFAEVWRRVMKQKQGHESRGETIRKVEGKRKGGKEA
jgi:predicted CopG family antitoxin